MSIEHRPISPLRQRMIEDMRLRQLSEKTQGGYLRWVKDFTRFLGRAPDTSTAEDLRRYQLHLSESCTSRISLNAAVGRAAILLRDHPWARRTNGGDEPCARGAHAAGGVESRRGRALARCGAGTEV